MLEFTRRPLTT